MVAMLPAIVWFTFDSISEEFASGCHFEGSTTVASMVGSASTRCASAAASTLSSAQSVSSSASGSSRSESTNGWAPGTNAREREEERSRRYAQLTGGAADCMKRIYELREIAGQRIGFEMRDALKKYAGDADGLSALFRAWGKSCRKSRQSSRLETT